MDIDSKRRGIFRLLVLAPLLSLSACATTKPVGEWRNENFAGRIDNFLVIGVTSRHELRYAFEQKFAESLAAIGASGTESFRLIPSTRRLTREDVEAAIRERDFAGVLVTRLVGAESKEVYKLPSDYDYERGYFGYYDHAWQETNDGYYAQYRTLTLQTNLYEVASGDLVWSMKSEVVDASQPHEVVDDQIELTIKTLARRGLIATRE